MQPIATHIVLFREQSEKNEQALHGILGIRGGTEVPGHRGVKQFHSVQESVDGPAPVVRSYDRLAAATVSPDPQELRRLERSDEVELVVENRLRRLVRPPLEGLGFGTAVSGAQENELVDYLRGMRDAADLALGQLTGSHEGAGPTWPGGPARRPASTQLPWQDDTHRTWGLKSLRVPRRDRGGTGVRVAVLDTGLDLDHPDFVGRVQADDTRAFGTGSTVHDGNGHGTHCCGTVAGPLRPDHGPRYGVAPEVILIVGKVLDDSGSGYDSQILDGMDWSWQERQADVISMSIGSERGIGDPYSRLYQRVAERMERAGVLVVAAAGNSSRRPRSTAPVENPAACPAIVAVAALDCRERVASFSSCEMDAVGRIDCAAPGVAVHSSWTGGGYRVLDGTSMAAPHVSGLAACLQARHGVRGRELRRLLLQRTRSLGSPRDLGAGIVQLG